MKAIATKFKGPTNTRGATITAKAEGVKPVTISYDYEGADIAHAKAAAALCTKYGWKGELCVGSLADGTMVHVFIDDRNSYRV